MDEMMPKIDKDMSRMPEMMVDLNASQQDLMRQIMEYDFAAFDLHLYLDTHPDDERAIYLFNNCVEMSKKLREVYEPAYGPLTASASGMLRPFRWIVGPWPWEPEANFK
jgi:spore coat protein JB